MHRLYHSLVHDKMHAILNPNLYGCSDSSVPKLVVKFPQFWNTCLIGFLPPPSERPKSSPTGELPLAPPSGLGGLSSLFLRSRSSFFLGPAITSDRNAKFLKSWNCHYVIDKTLRNKWILNPLYFLSFASDKNFLVCQLIELVLIYSTDSTE